MLSRTCASVLPSVFVGKTGTLFKGTGSVWAWPCRLHQEPHYTLPSLVPRVLVSSVPPWTLAEHQASALLCVLSENLLQAPHCTPFIQ